MNTSTMLHSLKHLYRGKVRDSYEVDDDHILMVVSDRISAFDVVFDDPIPNKGKILQALTDFWFQKIGDLLPNHLTGISPESVVRPDEIESVRDRSVVAMKLQPIPIECVVRGYLSGSGWKEYQSNGEVCNVSLPPGLKMASRLPEPIFSPAGKAQIGEHDENIDFEEVIKRVGEKVAYQIRDYSLAIYRLAAQYALSKGIIIADTKFEFGLDQNGTVRLMDEVLTPDSSRFWALEDYAEGINPPSFDKQYIRDWLETQPWDKKAPAPRLPIEIIEKTAQKYQEALSRLVK